ncbi:hypothetical protein electrica_02258 [Klebsiella electrica]|nr:hypothetical protein electrica_02258 [Klebsiella electrica]
MSMNRDIRDIRLGSSQRHILTTQGYQVLPELINFRHDLAPGVQRLTCTIGNNGSGPVGQLIQTFGVIE